MKVLFDFQIFNLQRYGGISRYHVELIKQFLQDNEVEPTISYLISNNVLLKSLQLLKHNNLLPEVHSEKKDRLYYLVNRFLSNRIIKSNQFDVFHPTYFDPYFLSNNKKPFVVTIHDMIHERFPEMFDINDTTSHRKKLVSEKASKIIAVSEHTKADIIKHFGTPENKIRVIHHGHTLSNINVKKREIHRIEQFILYVGNRNRYKNFLAFVNSVTPFLIQHPEIKIICAGGGDFDKTELLKFKQNAILDSMKQLSATDDELNYLYQNALMFVFPSLYEGFGIPLLEAMNNECPIVCSCIAPFLEVADKAACYFNPLSPDSILESINAIYYNDELKKDLIEAGKKRLIYFNWKDAAIATKKVYEEIA